MIMYFFQNLMHIAFRNHAWAKLVTIHQTSDGWTGVIKDQLHDQEYIFMAYAVKSTKIVVPDTIDQLINLNKEKEG